MRFCYLLKLKSLLTTKTNASVVAGTIMAPCAMLVALYSLARFHLRLVAIRNGTSMKFVVDWIGPWGEIFTYKKKETSPHIENDSYCHIGLCDACDAGHFKPLTCH